VRCGAHPGALLDVELFGHERGAFTGASSARAGRLEQANGGTLYLDDVGDVPFALQGKLLRVLQEGAFEPLGSAETRAVDVRIIAGTHRDLARAITERAFRQDLYYHLDAISIELPPLRQRRADIPALLEHFLHKYAAENRKGVTGFGGSALEALLAHDWPGNVRELENAVMRAVVLARGPVISGELLPPAVRRTRESAPVRQMTFEVGTSIDEMERVAIVRTLEL